MKFRSLWVWQWSNGKASMTTDDRLLTIEDVTKEVRQWSNDNIERRDNLGGVKVGQMAAFLVPENIDVDEVTQGQHNAALIKLSVEPIPVFWMGSVDEAIMNMLAG